MFYDHFSARSLLVKLGRQFAKKSGRRKLPIEDQDDSPDPEPAPENDRLANTDWYICGHCLATPTINECVCCREIGTVEKRSSCVECITLGPSFSSVVLHREVLERVSASVHDSRARGHTFN